MSRAWLLRSSASTHLYGVHRSLGASVGSRSAGTYAPTKSGRTAFSAVCEASVSIERARHASIGGRWRIMPPGPSLGALASQHASDSSPAQWCSPACTLVHAVISMPLRTWRWCDSSQCECSSSVSAGPGVRSSVGNSSTSAAYRKACDWSTFLAVRRIGTTRYSLSSVHRPSSVASRRCIFNGDDSRRGRQGTSLAAPSGVEIIAARLTSAVTWANCSS